MHKPFLIAGSLLGALAVALGAFGAHGLKKMVPAETVASFQTGVQYQMYHALALLAVAIIYEKFPGNPIRWVGLLFIIGIIFFSGSLYLLTILKATNTVGLQGIGIITPFGGLFFIAGWLMLLIAVMKKN
ncbi:MAG: DUF423 domain-containing protein [Bacteroidota bacterium]|nr:DUF423 domain-containing protein [Bacteroidota bacterium]